MPLSESVPLRLHMGGTSEWEKARTDLLALPRASANGIEGNKDLLVDHSYILVVTGCCIKPWEESVRWLNKSHVLAQT